jgi:hypothetical protein
VSIFIVLNQVYGLTLSSPYSRFRAAHVHALRRFSQNPAPVLCFDSFYNNSYLKPLPHLYICLPIPSAA